MGSAFDEILKNNKFKETAIGLLLSYGGFSTFLPKLLQSISSINGTTTFDALTWFSIFYFLLPSFLFLTYWSFFGFNRVYADNKQRKYVVINLTSERHKCEWIFFVLRVLPFLLFFINRFSFHNKFFQQSSLIIIVFWFIAIGLGEFFFFRKRVVKALMGIENYNLRAISVLKQGVVISFLNPLLGIGLLYLSEPWYLYQDYMILVLWGTITFFAFFIFRLFVSIANSKKLKGASIKFFFTPYLMALSLIYLIPHVNRNMEILASEDNSSLNQILVDTLVLFGILFFVFVLVYFIFNDNFIGLKRFAKSFFNKGKAASSFYWIVLIAFLAIPYFFNNLIEHENRTYFERRLKATEKVTDKKLVPSFQDGVSDSGIKLLRFVHDNNHVLRLHGNWANFQENNPNKFLCLFVGQEYLLNFLNNIGDSLIFKHEIEVLNNGLHNCDCNNLDSINTRFKGLIPVKNFFYGKYKTDSPQLEKKDFPTQKVINEFYSDLFIHLKGTVFPNTIIPLSRINSVKDITSHYLHPLNYYSYVVDHYEEQLNLTRAILANLKYLVSLHQFQEPQSATPFYNFNSISFKMIELIEEVNGDISGLIEMKGAGFKIDSSSNNIRAVEKKFNGFLLYKENQKIERIKNAQVIYQSYLYDYQRIGVFLFLFQLIIFGTLYHQTRLEEKREKEFQTKLEEERTKINDGKNDSQIKNEIESQNRNHLSTAVIALIAISAMLIPLLKEIKAENIDPTKKYWMLNLSNWYSPEIVFPETPILEKKQEPVEKNNNNILESSLKDFLENYYSKTEEGLNTLRADTDSLKNLKSEFEGLQSEFNKIKETTESIDKIIKK